MGWVFNPTLASVVRDPSPEPRCRLIDKARRRFEASDKIAPRAKFGRAGEKRDLMGPYAYWSADLFVDLLPE